MIINPVMCMKCNKTIATVKFTKLIEGKPHEIHLCQDCAATVSPYQNPAAIREAGEAACAAAGVRFMPTDFRERYPEATRRSRELGMYRQNYCGCHLSMREAEESRARRREERRRAK